jgi:hypothetical protein
VLRTIKIVFWVLLGFFGVGEPVLSAFYYLGRIDGKTFDT